MAGSWYSRVRTLMRGRASYIQPPRFDRLDAQWISAKKDWQDAKRHAKERPRQSHSKEGLGLRNTGWEDITFSSVQESEVEESHEPGPSSAPAPTSGDDEPSRDSGSYQPEMDEMLCALYAHGGMDLSLPFPVVLKSRNKAAIILVVWIRKGPFSLNTGVRFHRVVFRSKDTASSVLPARYVVVSSVSMKVSQPRTCSSITPLT